MTAIFLKIAVLLTRSQSQDPAMTRLKLKFCSMCDSFLERSESFPVRKDNAARISIADHIIEWTRDLSNVGVVFSFLMTTLNQLYAGKRWFRQCNVFTT